MTEAQNRARSLNADLSRAIFLNDPAFSSNGGSWRWHSYQHIPTGTDIRVDLLEGKVIYFKHGFITTSGLKFVTIPLDVFSDKTVVLTKWKLELAEVLGPPEFEQMRLV